MRDLNSLPKTLKESLVEVGGKTFMEYFQVLIDNKEHIPFWIPHREGQIRRLAAIEDKEGKTRVIAILDYFSQTVLKPVHLFLFSILRRIPQDMTFNQDGFQDLVKTWDDPVFYSVDLTSATDRFPISLIGKVLGGRFPES